MRDKKVLAKFRPKYRPADANQGFGPILKIYSKLYTMRRDLLNNVLRLWAGIFLLCIYLVNLIDIY